MPEYDGSDTAVGICRRGRDGSKRSMPGGSRGLYLPRNFGQQAGPIFCPEGFSCTAALVGMGLAAVGRPSCRGGTAKLAHLLSRISADRTIVVLAENDGKPDGEWPGKAGAEATAEGLSQSLHRPVLVAFPPGGLKDLREWFRAQDPDLDDPEVLEELGRQLADNLLAGAREFAPWGPPTPLGEAELPLFPVEVFSPWLRRYVVGLSVATQTPPDLPAMLALSATAAACAKRMMILVRDGYWEPLNIYTATTLPSAARKSSVFREIVRPIEEHERELCREAGPAIEVARTNAKIAEHQLGELQKKAAKAGSPEADEARQQAEALAKKIGEEPAPCVPRLIADDATPERLATIMASNGGRLASLSAEGGIFGMMGGRYQARQQAPNIDIYLKAHAGDTIRVDRVGRPSEFIDRPSLTLGLAVQEVVIRGLADNPTFRGRGLYGRFLFSMPASLVGRRQLDPPPIPVAVAEEYRHRMREMLALPGGTDAHGNPAEHVLGLSAGAYASWLAFAGEIEPRLAPLADLHHIGDWAGKLPGAVARLAGLLHASDLAGEGYPWEQPIPAATMERAVAIGRYLIPHAMAAFFAMGADPAIGDAVYVRAWIVRHGMRTVTRKECFDGTRGRFKKVEDLEVILQILEKHDVIRRRVAPARQGPGRPPSPSYDVNPAILRVAISMPSDEVPAVEDLEADAPTPAGSLMAGRGRAEARPGREDAAEPQPAAGLGSSAKAKGHTEPLARARHRRAKAVELPDQPATGPGPEFEEFYV